jgi:hypothetical protein
MTDKNEKIFRYIKLRITENFLATWYTVFQQMCNYIVPILLILIYVNRLVAFVPGKSYELDYTKIHEKINSVGRTNFDLFKDQESMGVVFSEMSSKGLFTAEYQEGVATYLIFWYFFSSTLAYLFSLLYYRKFVGQ